MGRLYKLFTSGVSDLDGAASLDMQGDGVITSILICLEWESVGATLGLQFELSFSSTNSLATSDTTAAIASLGFSQDQATAVGSIRNDKELRMENLAIPYQAGERIYLHRNLSRSAPAAARCWVYLYCEETGGARRGVRLR